MVVWLRLLLLHWLQEQLYKEAGIHELVKAAAQGFHATVFACAFTSTHMFTRSAFPVNLNELCSSKKQLLVSTC